MVYCVRVMRMHSGKCASLTGSTCSLAQDPIQILFKHEEPFFVSHPSWAEILGLSHAASKSALSLLRLISGWELIRGQGHEV